MIYPSELDGLTHEYGLEENIPFVVSGTPEYDNWASRHYQVAQQLNLDDIRASERAYKIFSDQTDYVESQLREPVEDLGESIDEILYTIDNERVPENGKEHIETELQDVKNSFQLCKDELLEDMSRNKLSDINLGFNGEMSPKEYRKKLNITLLQEVDRYISGLEEGVSSVKNLIDSRDH
jgi:hypothetical protein